MPKSMRSLNVSTFLLGDLMRMVFIETGDAAVRLILPRKGFCPSRHASSVTRFGEISPLWKTAAFILSIFQAVY